MIISKNCIVTLQYHVTDEDGQLIDQGNEPLVYLHGGYDNIFEPIEAALEGKALGDTFKVALRASEAFGEYDEELILVESLNNLPENLAVGMQFEGGDNLYIVTDIKEDRAVLDGNHPLAGLDLIFSGTVKEIQLASEEEAKAFLGN